MTPTLRPLLFLLVSGALLAFGDARAQQQPAPVKPERNEQPQRRDADLQGSVRRVERQTGGEVLRAEPMQRDGREVYRLKVLTSDGRVRVMQDDPQQRRQDPPQGGRRGGGKPKSDAGSDDSGDDASQL